MQRTGGRRARGLWTFSARLAMAMATVTAGVLAVVTVGAGATTAAKGTSSAPVVVSTAETARGTILVAGPTVYTRTANGTSCTAQCLKAHPPVLLSTGQATATAGSGVDATKLGTAPAGHGKRQVTYAGKRLFRFAKDRAAGAVHGNVKDRWGTWSTVTVASVADPTTTAPTTAPTTTPETVAPATAPPATEPPRTAPPETTPPATEPTTPKPPGSGGVGF